LNIENAPLISIIIPAWNSQETIARAILSIGTNAGKPLEVIVVDDGSTDATYETAIQAMQDSGIENGVVLQQPNSGPGGARNTGAKRAKGRYLAFLDADDFWLEWTSETCLDVLIKSGKEGDHPTIIFLQNLDFEFGNPPRNPVRSPLQTRKFDSFIDATICENSTRFGSGTAIISRKAFALVGGFNPNLRCAEDTDLFLRLFTPHQCLVITSPDMVAIETGGGTTLTSDFRGVNEGLQFLLQQDKSGRYPDSPIDNKKRRVFLAGSTAYTILKAFASGNIGAAYMLYVRHFGTLVKGKNWHWLLRLPILPLLHLIRPNNFSFRWRKQH